MSLADLVQRVAPPATPICPGSIEEWQAFEDSVGLRFPREYREVSITYGTGSFLTTELGLINPFDPILFPTAVERELRTRKDSYCHVPYPLYPEPGGLYPLGSDCSSVAYYWLTQPASEPDRWPIVCFAAPEYWLVTHYPLTEFLLRMMTNRLDSFLELFGAQPLPDAAWVFTFRPEKLKPRRKGRSKKKP